MRMSEHTLKVCDRVKDEPEFKVRDIVRYKNAIQKSHRGDLEIISIRDSDDYYTTVRQIRGTGWTFHVPMHTLVASEDVPAEQLSEVTKENKIMTSKYYRVKKETVAWNEGAVLEYDGSNQYKPISDLWDTDARDRGVKLGRSYAECDYIVENSPEWFERVYDVTVLGKVKYLVKDAAQKAYSELHKTK